MLIQANALSIPLAGESVDAIITDPPYGLSFMGKEWDRGVPGVPFWVEALPYLAEQAAKRIKTDRGFAF